MLGHPAIIYVEGDNEREGGGRKGSCLPWYNHSPEMANTETSEQARTDRGPCPNSSIVVGIAATATATHGQSQ